LVSVIWKNRSRPAAGAPFWSNTEARMSDVLKPSATMMSGEADICTPSP
jgi:hypothetical protein